MTLAYMTNGDSSGKVYVIDANSNKLLNPAGGITVGNAPFGVAFSPDGSQAVVTNNHDQIYGSSGSISFINTVTGTVDATRTLIGRPNGVSIAPSGTHTYAYIAYEDIYSPSSSGNDLITVYDMATQNLVTDFTLDSDAMPWGVAVTPDNSYVYVALSYSNLQGGPGKIVIIATGDTPTLVATFEIAASGVDLKPYGIAITPTGSPPTAYVTVLDEDSGTGKITYFAANGSAPSLSDIHSIDLGAGIEPFGVATDGTMVYVTATDHNSSTNNRLYYLSVGSGSASYISTGTGNQPVGAALTPDGNKLFVGARNSNNTLVYTPGSPPTLLTTISSSGGGSFGVFIQQNIHANTPFVGGASEWFGC